MDSNFALLSEAVFPSLTGLVIMLLAWEGYKLFYGRSVADGLTNSVILMIKYAVIMALFGSASLVDDFLGGLFEDVPAAIGAAVNSPKFGISSAGDDLMTQLDAFTKTASDFAFNIIRGVNIGEVFEGLLILLATWLFTLFAAFQLGLTTIVTKIFLAITPLALTAMLFEKTRGIFEGWLRVLTTMAALKILLVIVVSLLLAIFEDAPASLENNAASMIVFMVSTLLMAIIVIQLPNFASQLGGGVAVGAATITAATVLGGIGAASKAVSGGIGASRAGMRAARGAQAYGEEAVSQGLRSKDVISSALRGAAVAAYKNPDRHWRERTNRIVDANVADRAKRFVGQLARARGTSEGES